MLNVKIKLLILDILQDMLKVIFFKKSVIRYLKNYSKKSQQYGVVLFLSIYSICPRITTPTTFFFLPKMAAHTISKFPTTRTPSLLFSDSDSNLRRRPDPCPPHLGRTLRPPQSVPHPCAGLGTNQLSLHSSNLRQPPHLSRHRPITATVSFCLPTA